MYQQINNVLRKFLGIKVVASGEGRFFAKAYKPSKAILVEFVGVAGVGKTTLFRSFFKNHKQYYSEKKFYLMHEDTFNFTTFDNSVIYQMLAEAKLDKVLESNISSTDKMRIIKYFYSVLIKDFVVTNNNKEHIVLSEEGLLHNFDSCIQSLEKNSEHALSFLNNRAIIFCTAQAEIVAYRIQKRFNKTGILVPQHKVESFDMLVQRQEEALKNKDKAINFYKNEGIPILEINTGNCKKENISKIYQFVKQLENSKSKL